MIKLAAFIDEYDKTLDGQIEGLKKHNIKLIELRSVDSKNVLDLSLEEAKRIQEKLEENGLSVWSIGSPLGKVDITCDFDEYLIKCRHIFELANIFKTDKIRMFSFYKAYESKELVFKYLNKMVEVAKEYGVTLYHENEKAIYGDVIERVLEIKENVPGLKFIYDPANFIQCDVNPDESIDKLFSFTNYFHIKDVVAETQELVPAGHGSAKIDELVSLMDAKDYTLTIEPHLAMFEVFNVIDKNPMKHKFEFKNQKEAFDTAVNELKKILKEAKYTENEDGIFIKPRVRYGVVGLGNIGSQHIGDFFKRNLIRNATVTAIADSKQTRIDRIVNLYPDQKFDIYHSAEELIDKADINAVVIAVPHYLHPGLVIKCLKKNLNVICEKPAGVYTKAVKEMNEVAKNSKALFTMMFNQRTNCLYRKMREMILGGKIGEIKRINWIITSWYRPQSYYDSGDWRATWTGEGGGVLMNQCPHQLDLLQWTTGMMPKNVTAFVNFGKYHKIEVEDEVTAYFEYENGATGVFVTCTADAPGDNRFEVLGTKGKLIVENDELVFYENDQDEREFNKTFTGGFGSPKYTRTVVETDGKNPQHSGIINNFAEAILGYSDLFVSGVEGLAGVELDNAMRLSGFLGSEKVSIPVDDDLYYSELEKRIKTSTRKAEVDRVIDTEHSYQ